VSLADCDPRFTLLQNLQLVRSRVKSRAPGIRRCPDCDQPWIDDHTGLAYCPVCWVGRWQRCRTCRAQIAMTVDGNPLCDSCTDQFPLF
jgi:hypothetical protein